MDTKNPSYMQRMRAEKARRATLREQGREGEILAGRPAPIPYVHVPRFPEGDFGYGFNGKRYHGD